MKNFMTVMKEAQNYRGDFNRTVNMEQDKRLLLEFLLPSFSLSFIFFLLVDLYPSLNGLTSILFMSARVQYKDVGRQNCSVVIFLPSSYCCL